MKKYFLLLTFCFFCLAASAQKYRTAAGIRIGKNDFGGTIQQKIMERNTLEGIVLAGTREVSGTALFEHHFPIMGKGFNWYLGAGAHVGHLKDAGGFYGGDVILGTEMKLPIFPILLSLDVKPAFHVNHEDWGRISGGFSIRYILVKEKREKRGLFGIFDRSDNKSKKNKNKAKEEPKKGNIFGF
ncbi:hypothetical protein [Adhaeribacter aquaticus]|uniref:hypothetical protein n=1 Tax=Adhaeribacter aquaticus TaxID=299567 RepID=UPI0004129C30|nr:hypothetical protein [Adhaeribacter aquaticus]